MVMREAAMSRGSMSERRQAMANRVRSTALICGVAVFAVLLLMAHRGQAQTVASDRAAGYVVFPKVVVDVLKTCVVGGVDTGTICTTSSQCTGGGICEITNDTFHQGRRRDTLLQLTSTAVPSVTDNGCRVVECFYLDTTKHCSNSNVNLTPNGPCRTNTDCLPGGTCAFRADCGGETNFWIVLSANQPVGWSANFGGVIPSDIDGCALGQTIPAAPEPFFVGEVKCVEVDGSSPADSTGTPLLANELKGEATIYDIEPGSAGGVDVRGYNAVGVQAVTTSGDPIATTCVGGSNQGHTCGAIADCPGGACEIAMCLGSDPDTGAVCPTATHARCPSTLILDHFFDFAPDAVTSGEITTDLTLVPCSENVGSGTPSTTAQFTVFNEFEQRFSASLNVRCLREIQLSDIDTLVPGDRQREIKSIFSYNVQGTLTGQTLIRPVIGSELDVGHGLLGVAEEFGHEPGVAFPAGSDAFNLHYAGTTPAKSDVVILPAAVILPPIKP
jgi:hypothetical protein